jgi:hypothetical protein
VAVIEDAPQVQRARAIADWISRLAAVRVVFTAYLLLIAVCLAFYIAIGFINP